MNICSFLRWKGYNQQQDTATVLRVFRENHVSYRCLKTMQVWSPKGEIVAPECCSQARACFLKKKLPGDAQEEEYKLQSSSRVQERERG